jgi:hypothetical protein
MILSAPPRDAASQERTVKGSTHTHGSGRLWLRLLRTLLRGPMCRRLAISVAAQRLVSRDTTEASDAKFLADGHQGPGQRSGAGLSVCDRCSEILDMVLAKLPPTVMALVRCLQVVLPPIDNGLSHTSPQVAFLKYIPILKRVRHRYP